MAGQAWQEQLVHRLEEALDLAPPPRLTGRTVDELDVEVGAHLVHVVAGEVVAVGGIQDTWNPADVPRRVGLPGDCLVQGEGE
jgi:hypothetical protein